MDIIVANVCTIIWSPRTALICPTCRFDGDDDVFSSTFLYAAITCSGVISAVKSGMILSSGIRRASRMAIVSGNKSALMESSISAPLSKSFANSVLPKSPSASASGPLANGVHCAALYAFMFDFVISLIMSF